MVLGDCTRRYARDKNVYDGVENTEIVNLEMMQFYSKRQGKLGNDLLKRKTTKGEARRLWGRVILVIVVS